MGVKEYLERVGKLKSVIVLKSRQLEYMEASASELKAVNYDSVKVSKTASTNAAFEDMIEHIENLREELNADIRELGILKSDIVSMLNMMKNTTYSQVLFFKYVELKNYAELCGIMGYCESYIRALHSRAVKAFEKIYMQYKEAG